ncbi:ribonuclease P protein subunit p30 [Cheilinus undulatus]|uniref:ribonuclease P protein subunit p30 n=1 Tax=Cheilinus undulatus TaxID=241271 RepID=UPI001BD23609|nr:ribonuclease P protein subunit p30 [Cheilinus undulatus]
MSVFMDLNVTYSADRIRMKSLIETAAHLGYSTIAVNYTYELTVKKTKEVPVPTPIKDLIDQLPIVQGRSRPIRVLNRLTVVMSEAGHFRKGASEFSAFDLLAVQPTTEKLFHAACCNLDVDIVCIVVTERLPFIFKRSPVNVAVERGIVFEVQYSAAIRDSTRRRYTIANAIALVDTCKGKNVILSSSAETALELRGPYDITNLGLLFGLSDGDAKEAVSSTCRSVVLHGESRKTAFGIVYTMKRCSETPDQQEAPPEKGDAPPAKKSKQVTE